MLAADAHHRMRTLPVASLHVITGGRTALVLAPHPDDESLGCGGLIAQACAAGTPPLVAVLTDGAASHPGSRAWPGPRLAALRVEEARAAVGALGLAGERVRFLGVPDTAAPLAGAGFEAAVGALCELVREHGVGVVAGPWRHDPHCDHEAAAAMAVAVAARCGVRRLSYPVWGWTLPGDTVLPDEAIAGWRLDVSAELAAKRRAIAAHASQHGRVVTDDPGGFVLPEALLGVFAGRYEVFLEAG